MPPKLPIFMDSQSTTPMDPRVLEVMLPYFTEKFGHPASRTSWLGGQRPEDPRADRHAIGARDPWRSFTLVD
jgi:cysteine sulfinate desulfinase/cysteine desulfurase-like protein